MTESFEPPSKYLSLLATVGGVVTAVAAIAGLEYVSHTYFKTDPAAQVLSGIGLKLPPQLTEDDINLEKKILPAVNACKFDGSIAPNTGLAFEIKSFDSKAMGEKRKYGIVLPPGYHDDRQKFYPVVFLLHGGHGDAGGWQACGALTVVLSQLYKTGRFPPAIVITPDGSDKRGSSPYWDPQYYDGPNGQVATLIGSEIVQEVKSRYRVLNDAKFWAMGGVSSGGWGAFNIGLRYLNNFQTLFSHSGYFKDKDGTGPQNSPIKLVQNLTPQQRQQLRAYVDAGFTDGKYLDATEQFHKELLSLGIAHGFIVYPGGHGIVGTSGWQYWHKHLAYSLEYVGQQWQSSQAHQEEMPTAEGLPAQGN